MATPAWQRKAGKSKSGGLNARGRRSYNRATGGKAFCARMKGMKKKLTSRKTARDPNSRINKALRKWAC